jgi:hypothetical protein
MEDLAKSESLTIQTAGPFSRWAPVPELPNASALKEEVFKLEMEPPGNLGGPIEAGDAFIVFELVEIRPPRLPELDEVRDRVKNAATQYHTRQAISDKSSEIGEAVRAAMTGETTFTEAAQPLGLNVVTPPAKAGFHRTDHLSGQFGGYLPHQFRRDHRTVGVEVTHFEPLIQKREPEASEDTEEDAGERS